MEGQNNFGKIDSPKLGLLKSPNFIWDTYNYGVISLVTDIIQGWCLGLGWSSDHLSLQMYPHHLCIVSLFPGKHPFMGFHTTYQLFAPATIPLLWTKIVYYPWLGWRVFQRKLLCIVLSLHPYIAMERQSTTLVHSSLYQRPEDCFTKSHLPHRVMVIGIQRRKQSTGIVGYPLDA
jgi:hypothetical protein